MISKEDWELCIKVLQQVKRNPDIASDNDEFKGLVSSIYKIARKERRKQNKEEDRASDAISKHSTYIFQKNDENNLEEVKLIGNGEYSELKRPQSCYICKVPYTRMHSFYHSLCPDCSELNFLKRNQSADLTGRVCLLTGGRIKIGFEIALRILRAGGTLIVTTRFPEDAKQRFQQQKDYERWSSNLKIYGLDLRSFMQVEQFVEQVYAEYSSLDIIINNAAQTIHRPIEFYSHLLKSEPVQYLVDHSRALPQFTEFFPENKMDKHQQQVDLRETNSWKLKLDEVSVKEMVEVQLVNSIAPFTLNSKLKPLLLKSNFYRKFIVNVSAMEGKFNRSFKSVFHPHTNMGKAALNMMTRTSGEDYAQDNIYMTSVDTGWITDENPHPIKSKMRENGFVTPIDIVDGACRVLDPVFRGINSEEIPYYGVFLKDYKITDW